MENKKFNSDTMVKRNKIPNIDGPVERLLPKFLLSDLIDKSEKEERIVTDSTRDENFESNFSNFDLYDSHEENDPILDELKFKDKEIPKIISNSRTNDEIEGKKGMTKFYSSEDIKKYADEYKTDFQKKFKNNNINLNQNINILTNNNYNRNSSNISNNNLNFNEAREVFYASALGSQCLENKNLKIYKFQADNQITEEEGFIPKKFELNKNSAPYTGKFGNNLKIINKPSFSETLKFSINDINNGNIARSKLEEVENNFFFESDKGTFPEKNFITNNDMNYNNISNNPNNFTNNYNTNLNTHNSNDDYKTLYNKNKEESVFQREALEQKNDNYLFNVFTQNPLPPFYYNNKLGFHSANNSPWRNGRSSNSQDNFSANNSYNLTSLEESNFLGNQFYFHTPGNSPGRNRPHLRQNFDSTQYNKKNNFNSQNINNKNKASLFNHFEKEEKGEEFKDLEELLGSIDCELWLYASSQKGSRNLQKLLNKILPQELDVILEKIKEHFSFLMTDTYGNYFCQKLIQCCSSEQRVFILKHIQREFGEISCNSSGTHAIQSLIEIINLPMEEKYVKSAVEDQVLKLSYDINGTHVIQKILSCIKEENREEINQIILSNLDNLVSDSNGICVIKKFINSNKEIKKRKFILDKISLNSLEIVQNPFGNYVIQHILEEWGAEIANSIVEVIVINIISLSMQKFSSNVVEKCFDNVHENMRKRMIRELFNTSKLSSLLKNKYGNYVLQKAIQIMSYDEKNEIREYLIKKVIFSSNKEKARLNALIDMI